MGGYIPGFENMDKETWEKMLANVRVDDASQAEMAAAITARFFGEAADEELEKALAEAQAASDSASAGNLTGIDMSKMVFPRSPGDYKLYTLMGIEVGTNQKLITLRGVRDGRRPKDLRKTFVSELIKLSMVFSPLITLHIPLRTAPPQNCVHAADRLQVPH